MALAGPICPYCQSTAILQDASAVYGPRFEGRGNVWTCARYPECDSYVGCASGPIPRPLGTMANRELRGLRKALYRAKGADVDRRIWDMNEEECRAELAQLGIGTKGPYDE